MEYPNKKLLLLMVFAVLAVLLVGLYVLLRSRGVLLPAAEQPPAAPVVQQPITEEKKMQILQGLATERISAVERKSILRMLTR